MSNDKNRSTADLLVADFKEAGQSYEAMKRIKQIRDDEYQYNRRLFMARMFVASTALVFAAALGYLIWCVYYA